MTTSLCHAQQADCPLLGFRGPTLLTAPAHMLDIGLQEAEMQASQQTMELQWKSYVSNLKASGSLSSALAVCDVSGSMAGEPMQVSQAWA